MPAPTATWPGSSPAPSPCSNPVLRWRALLAEDDHAFGTVPPALEQYTEAENAVRRLQATLARITAG
ncbi:hypothetical protein [Kitasatospora sp. NPDC001683]